MLKSAKVRSFSYVYLPPVPARVATLKPQTGELEACNVKSARTHAETFYAELLLESMHAVLGNRAATRTYKNLGIVLVRL